MRRHVVDSVVVTGSKGLVQFGERYRAKTLEEQRFCFGKTLFQRSVHRFFDKTVGIVVAHPYGQQRWRADGAVNIQKRQLFELYGQLPAAAVAFFACDISGLAEARHDAPDDGGIGGHGAGEDLGCHRARGLRHVQEHVQNAGKSTVAIHATSCVS
jgi:hypothetical protein